MNVNALCSACWVAPTTLLFLQFARISVLNILSYLRNYGPNLPASQCVVLSMLGCADYTVVSSICKNKVLNILSYLINYWANRHECQRVVLSRLGCADYTIVLQFARITVLNILSYLRNYWANRPECQRVVLSRLGCADYTVVSTICKNNCLTYCHISETIGPIDLNVNALCSAGWVAPTTLSFFNCKNNCFIHFVICQKLLGESS